MISNGARPDHHDVPGDDGDVREALHGLRTAVRTIHGRSLDLSGLRSHGPSDLAVVLRDSTLSNGTLVHAAEALERCPEVAVAQRAGRRLLVRLEDDHLAEVGRVLEEGVEDRRALNSAAFAGRRFMIQYLDPNATKALHVGHLRNIALGHAFRSALESAGADVFARSAIGDAGQQIGEAMAGCLAYGGGEVRPAPGVKGDQVVGAWYARYVAEHRPEAGDVADEDRHLLREVVVQDDLATSLLNRWQEGDPEVIRLWRALRDWAVAGQNETLARLGVRFDVEIDESESFPRIADFVAVALHRGVLTHVDSGALMFETGDEDYPLFPLARPDGFPTQNLRTLVLWYELMAKRPDLEVINVVGEEWRAHTIYVRAILERLDLGLPVQPTHDVVHGMITAGEGDMSSSDGDVLLIDDLLDEVAASEPLRTIARPERAGCTADDLAVIAALGFCLNRPLSKGMAVTADRILDPQGSAGMMLARAWAKAWSPASDGAACPAPEDDTYRFAVMYCQFQADVLQQALEQRDLLALVRSLTRMSKWYISTPTAPCVDRVMRTLLTRGLRSIGALPPGMAATSAPATVPVAVPAAVAAGA